MRKRQRENGKASRRGRQNEEGGCKWRISERYKEKGEEKGGKRETEGIEWKKGDVKGE